MNEYWHNDCQYELWLNWVFIDLDQEEIMVRFVQSNQSLLSYGN